LKRRLHVAHDAQIQLATAAQILGPDIDLGNFRILRKNCL